MTSIGQPLKCPNLEEASAQTILDYIRDEKGTFDHSEMVSVISDLQSAMKMNEILGQSNRFFKKTIFALMIFCTLLLASVIGLTYTVTVLSAQTKVDVNSIMRSARSNSVVATDSAAFKIVTRTNDETGAHCLNAGQVGEMIYRIENGNNVIVESNGESGTQIDRLSGSMNTSEGAVCFTATTGQQVCVFPSEECSAASGRRLDEDLDACLGLHDVFGASLFAVLFSEANSCVLANCPGDSLYTVAPPSECVCDCTQAGGDYTFTFGSD